MDLVIGALPAVQDRLGRLATQAAFESGEPDSASTVVGLAALVRDNDLPRIDTGVDRAIKEDGRNFGRSESLGRELPPKAATLRREIDALVSAASGATPARDAVVAASHRVQDALIKLWRSAADELDILLDQRSASWRAKRFNAFSLTGAALVLSTLLAVYVIRLITQPLGQLTAAATAAATRGDLSLPIPEEGPDEIGQLAGAFHAMTGRFRSVAEVAGDLADGNVRVDIQPLSEADEMGTSLTRMVTNLSEVAKLAERMAAGDLRVAVKPHSRDDVMGHALETMVGSLSTLTGQVQRAAIVMNSSVTDIAATARQQQATTSEVAATTTEIGATSKEIYATSKELLKTMNEVADVAEETASLATGGQTGLVRMEETMNLFVEALAGINARLGVLSEKAANINQVVTTISKVADLTNLLSLNAAIEAEKAGEFGRGFAVVATEIRRLADQTAVSSYDIEQMVKEMSSAVAAGVMGMDKFAEQIRRGVQDVRQVSTQLSGIIRQVQTLTPRVLAVNEGMEAQATGADQITQALSGLSDATQQTADSLRQSNASIERLHDASRGLLKSLDGFKLKGA
ncbi:MAG: methyl-accepting chemotaxis protein [Verrucomicrobia bacterium]|nr:methyl-accepting chemotaxis protein [Verrucomicrobiota bacterium]